MKFNGLNFSDWCEQIRFHLGVLDLDLALLSEKPAAITSASSDEDRSFYKSWERSNRLSLTFMRITVANNIKSTIKNTEDAKEFMKSVEKCSQSESADKSLAGTLMSILTNIKFDGSCTIHEHILEMTNLAARLKTMGMEVNENFLVTFILNSLPSECGPFHMNYNTLKDKWNVHELQSMLIQEEARLKKPIIHSANLMGHKGAGKKNGKGNHGQLKIKQSSAPIHKKGQIKDKCRFCNKPGHYQKDCLKRKAWFENKVERQLDRKVKILRSDRGGEYYGKYDENGQCPDPFAKFLESHGICAQYTMPGTPQQNGVAERRNQFDLSIDNDPISFSQAIKGDNSTKWLDAMKEELKSMNDNEVWDLVELPKESYTQKNGIDYKETFSPVSKKDSLRIIMTLVAHYDLELHQMNVKTAFLNGNLDEEVFMDQPEDSDFAGCVDTRKFTFGYLFLLAEGAISWKSAKQSIIAASTMEAEFVACFEATVHGLWLWNFISGLRIVDSIAKPLRIYCDNSATVFF
ncbi:Retrovirus-related Pol polyprotein from transposon TNT 1-94 [Cucumis melo var. makuwa]|uniref:Retrovirus-related Pol polyprotein from transposon TNT 1-94 n=1 Tax=Cucumis melo var. makuwa TaxID=1194695 RepID=A0A5A7UJC4_CUCMM|nr:Retrovirus-related Pol polyprotein from transposon TNT 1-94 [Cucumis melo var. makuwa]